MYIFFYFLYTQRFIYIYKFQKKGKKFILIKNYNIKKEKYYINIWPNYLLCSYALNFLKFKNIILIMQKI